MIKTSFDASGRTSAIAIRASSLFGLAGYASGDPAGLVEPCVKVSLTITDPCGIEARDLTEVDDGKVGNCCCKVGISLSDELADRDGRGPLGLRETDRVPEEANDSGEGALIGPEIDKPAAPSEPL